LSLADPPLHDELQYPGNSIETPFRRAGTPKYLVALGSYASSPFRPQRVLLNQEGRENAQFFPLLDKEGGRGWLIPSEIINVPRYQARDVLDSPLRP
jgi:hypothetical protein